MILSTGLRVQVERLLRGDIQPQDLHKLFFNMREESGGRGLVSEIAHFLAHPGIRDQGLTTQTIRDQVAFLKLSIPFYSSPIFVPSLPASAPDALRANLRRIDKALIKRELKMNRVHVERVLERILARIIPTGVGTVTKAEIRSKEEYDVFQLIAGYAKGGSIFTDDDLFKDFASTLQKQNLLHKSEVPALARAQAAISLFALVTMHGSEIDLGDGTTASVAMARDKRDNLAIFAFFKTKRGGRPLDVGCWIFETTLPVADYCEGDVATPSGRHPFVGDFEMTDQLRVGRSVST